VRARVFYLGNDESTLLGLALAFERDTQWNQATGDRRQATSNEYTEPKGCLSLVACRLSLGFLALFVSERDHGIDAGRAPGGKIAGKS
jgi:hypothetical protein